MTEKENTGPPVREWLREAWLPAFTWLLVANAIYILIFYLLMKIFG